MNELDGAKSRIESVEADQKTDQSSEMRLVAELLDEGIRSARSFNSMVNPPMAADGGLQESVDAAVRHLAEPFGVELAFQFTHDAAILPADYQVLVYPMIRELIVNAIKHARATKVTVASAAYDGALFFTVSDDGKGTPPEIKRQSATTGGFGLPSIRERLKRVGGQLEILPGDRQGTKMVIQLPVPDSQQ